jgi:tetratricopeptide (TPR) repeat protein
MSRVLERLSEMFKTPQVAQLAKDDPGRIRTMHTLTGGNPRTVVMLFEILALEANLEGENVRGDLERLLDRCTALYKARFEALPPQSQQVVDALAIHWDPITAGDLAKKMRMDVNTISSQLNRLTRQGSVEKVAYFREGAKNPKSKTGFQISERFFNIWYLMRASRRVRRKLIWLVQFLKLFYSQEELQHRARSHLRSGMPGDSESRMRRAEYGLALGQSLDAPPLRSALESVSIKALVEDPEHRKLLSEILDLKGEDADLKPIVDHQQFMVECREKVMSAQVDWEGWNPVRFWELLGGALLESPQTKRGVADQLEQLGRQQIENLMANYESNLKHSKKVLGKAATALALSTAIREGYMEVADDVDGADRAGEILNQPGLPPLAMALRLELGEPLLEQLKTILPQATAPYPWWKWADLAALADWPANEVESAYRHAIELNAETPHPWYGLGNLLKNHLERLEEAENAYRKAIEIDPVDAYPWNGLGNLLKNHLGRFEEAEIAYRKAIEVDPKFAYPWYGLGNLLSVHLGRFEEAEDAYRKAIDIDPQYASPWIGLGNLLSVHLGRFEEAEAAYRKAIEIDPLDASPWNSLAWLFYKIGKADDEAEAAARRAVELEADPHHTHTLATILVHRGKWEEAVPQARHFLTEGTPEYHERFWPDILAFFREVVTAGKAKEAVQLLDELEISDRWRPLREALAAIAAGTPDYLHSVAPEIRQPAEELMKGMTNEEIPDDEGSPKSG